MTEQDAWRQLLTFSNDIVDPRNAKGQLYTLPELLLVIMSGLLAGSQNAEDIAYFGLAHQDWLRTFSAYKHGMPAHDAILRILAALNPDAVETLVRKWVEVMLEAAGQTTDGGHVAFDGKTMRGSADKATGGAAVHMVGAMLTGCGFVLGNECVSKKSNEIVAIPLLIRSLNLVGATVTIDAMGCQRAIADEIREAGAHYVLQVKGNQFGLQAEVEAIAAEVASRRGGAIEPELVERHRSVGKGHGRVETRVCYVIRDLKSMTRRALWRDLSGVVVLLRETYNVGTQTTTKEMSHYILSDPAASAKDVSGVIRAHWEIENSLHWSLDVVWGEDSHQLRDATAAANLTRLRRLALSMVKHSTGDRMSGSRVRQHCAMRPQAILKVLAGEKIHQAARKRPKRSVVGRFGQGKPRVAGKKKSAS